jgi:hypothetical protein
MIISENTGSNGAQFETLLSDAHALVKQQLIDKSESYFLERSPIQFEKDVHIALCEAATGTDFEETIRLLSGLKFPDIVIGQCFGVEVKTSKTAGWSSPGNSIFEGSRVDDVERIYIYFGHLVTPVAFKYRPYHECLNEIRVTHSPRYLIDMDLSRGESIFDKIGIDYDVFRQLPDKEQVNVLTRHLREISQDGEEPWWMSPDDSPDFLPTVRHFSDLSPDEQNDLLIEAMIRFPEVFGIRQKKYKRLSTWLVARHGVNHHNLRDDFSASGKVALSIQGKNYGRLPKVLSHLQAKMPKIIEVIKTLPVDDLRYHWELNEDLDPQDALQVWAELVAEQGYQTLSSKKESNSFIVHLLGSSLGQDCPESLRMEMTKLGLSNGSP